MFVKTWLHNLHAIVLLLSLLLAMVIDDSLCNGWPFIYENIHKHLLNALMNILNIVLTDFNSISKEDKRNFIKVISNLLKGCR